MSKPNIIKDYDKLTEEIISQIKLYFPRGYEKQLITFKNAKGKLVSALPFEAEDCYYLVKMTRSQAQEIIRNDDDFDTNGILKTSAKEDLLVKLGAE